MDAQNAARFSTRTDDSPNVTISMQYEGNIIRPPSESDSIILQATAGCSHNKCTFCGAYRDKQFRYRKEELFADIEFAAKYCKRQRRVFLADGDALVLPFDELVAIISHIRKRLPWVKWISLYGNAKSIRLKSRDQLLQLKALGLKRIYLGLESGDDEVLRNIRKGETSSTMIAAARKVYHCGIFLSTTILLGIAGVSGSKNHAKATARTLNAMQPNQIAALSVMPIPGTELYNDIENGSFTVPDATTLLLELKSVIEYIQLDRVQFYANHASNFLLLAGRLARDKNKLLNEIDHALAGTIPLIPDHLRRL